jgi:CRISPR-associated protein Cpf1
LPLSDSESASFSFKPFESDREALIAVNDFYEKVITNNEELKEKESSQPVNLLEELKKILNNIQSSDKIFIRRSMLNSISARIFDKEGIENKWNIINQALVEYYGDKKIKGSPGDVINAINDKLGELDAEKRELAPTRKKKGQHKQEKSNELKKLEKEILRLKNKRKKFMGYLTAENGMSKWLRTKKYFSILVIESALLKYKCKQGLDEKIKSCISDKPICDYFKTLGKLNGETKDLFEKIIEEYNNVNELLVDVGNMEDEKRLEKDDKVKIKSFLERFNKKFENKNEDELSLLQFIKPLAIGEDVEDFDNGFYEGVTKDNTRQYGFSELYEQIASGNNGAAGILPIYNKVRSRFQKKDYSTDAIRLCFDKGTLAGGWTESNESTQYFTYLFRKENKKYNEKYKITDESRKEYEYFLGISHDTGLFSCNWGLKMEEQTGDEWDEFQRLNYYQLNPTKQNNILKKFLINFSAGNNHLQDKISKHFKEKNTTAITCAESLKTEFQSQFENLKRQNQLNSKLLNDLPIGPKSILFTTDYFESVKDFASLFNDLRKKEFKYLKVNKQELENALCGYSVDENGEIHTRQPLLLFKITNKDLSYAETHLAGKRNCDENGNERKARGEFKENLHTIYFRHLMSGSQNIIDLGTGMLFFRTASKERKITHEKEKPVKNKRWELLNEVDKENFKAESTFSYDLVKDRRFTYEKDKSEGKYFLHLSTQFNYMTGIGSDKADINNNVLEWIKSQKDNKDFRIIGIDRGERHLLYVTIVDYNGKIQKQFSLNIPEPEESKFKTDYKKLLDKSSSERRESQRNWDDAVMITKLKKGYLSYALNRICSEIIKDGKPNAIIVLEHLSRGFMQQRPIDNSVYAKFEEMLIKKLNWLTYKDQINEPTRAGGVLNGWQLTEEYSVRNIDIKKQNGIIFFVPAKYTSRIDPATGFVNFFSYSKLPFESANNARDFFSRFASIKYNNVAFEFDFDYENFKFSNENKRMKESNTDKKVKERKDSGFLFLVNDVAGEMKWTIRTNDSMRFTRDRKANEGRGGQKPINVFAYDEAVKKDADLKSKIEKIAGNINQQLKYLLKEVGAVDYTNGDIKKALQNNKLKADFFKKLLQLFFSAVTLRQNNGKTGAKEEDLINSLVVKRGGENITVTDTLKPENADSNGAYHIALKGLFLLKRLNEISIDEFEKSKKSKDGKSQWVPNSEWLNFVQSNFN